LSNPWILIFETKVQKFSKAQIKNSQYLIVDPHNYTYLTLYDNNIFELLNVYLNFTYFEKNQDLITWFQILKEQDHKLLITWYIYISHMNSINDKV